MSFEVDNPLTVSADETYKVVLVGDGAVGLTSLLCYHINGYPYTEYVPTVFHNYTSVVEVNGKQVELGLYDTAGQEDYNKLRPMCYDNADVFIIGFSVISRASFENIPYHWLPEVRYFYPNASIVLVGTQIDMKEDERTISHLEKTKQKFVSFNEGCQLAAKVQASAYFECSSYTGEGVREIFIKTAEVARNRKRLSTEQDEFKIRFFLFSRGGARFTSGDIPSYFYYEPTYYTKMKKTTKNKLTIEHLEKIFDEAEKKVGPKLNPGTDTRVYHMALTIAREKKTKGFWFISKKRNTAEITVSDKSTAYRRRIADPQTTDRITETSTDSTEPKDKASNDYTETPNKASSRISDDEQKIEIDLLQKEIQKLRAQLEIKTGSAEAIKYLKNRIGDYLIEPASRMTLGKIIGEGNFGMVYSGSLHESEKKDLNCAIKTLHAEQLSVVQMKEFLDEAMIMKDFDHENVLSLYGVVVQDGRPYVLLPYMSNGDLRKYVQNTHCTVRELLEFGRQIASGMAYLASRKFVHRDLAARNCMVSEDLVIKIADFGLARDMFEKDYYAIQNETRPLPFKWIAQECFETWKFSTESDVWAFGVTLWEMMTRGQKPYDDVPTPTMHQHLKSGARLRKPPCCPDKMYQLMLSCWNEHPEKRPTFETIVKTIHKFLIDNISFLVESQYSDIRRQEDSNDGNQEHKQVELSHENTIIDNEQKGNDENIIASAPYITPVPHFMEDTGNDTSYSDNDLIDAIRYHTKYLTRHVACDDHIDYLFAMRALSAEECTKIMEIQDNTAKMRKMLLLLSSKPDVGWAKIFLQSLKESSCSEAIAMLEKSASDSAVVYRDQGGN